MKEIPVVDSKRVEGKKESTANTPLSVYRRRRRKKVPGWSFEATGDR